eukprot:5817172-Pleurochrysis_carterae.AAC.2
MYARHARRARARDVQDGLYHSLRLHQGHSPSVLAQIEKDVPRTMTGHIFFRADNARGQGVAPRRRGTMSRNPKTLRLLSAF